MQIWKRNTLYGTVLSLALSGVAVAGAGAASLWFDGSLSGANTNDYWEIGYYGDGEKINFAVDAEGPGSNTLTVKFQQQKSSGGWTSIKTWKLDMPSDYVSGDVTVQDYTPGDEKCRFKLSRDIGTKKIFYWVYG